MKRAINLLIIVGVVCVFNLSMAFAEQAPSAKATNAGVTGAGKVTPEAQAVSQYALAYHLAQYGKQQKDPLALLSAARIIKATQVKEEKRTKTTEGTPSGQDSPGKVDSAEDLLAAAKAMAEGKDMALVAMIDKEMQAKADRGRVGGPSSHVDRVLGNTTDTYTIRFRGDEIARIAVIGDDNSDLDLFVYDENGNLIMKDDDSTSNCLVQWSPLWTGPFKVRVKNIGSRSSTYLLMTN